MTDLDQRVAILRDMWLFASCTDDELSAIAASAEPRDLPADTQVFAEGDPGDEFYAIVSGTAEARRGGTTVAELTSGSFFGEMAIIDGGARTASIVTTSPMTVLVLGRDEFHAMLSSGMPHVTSKLMGAMGQRIRGLQSQAGAALPF